MTTRSVSAIATMKIPYGTIIRAKKGNERVTALVLRDSIICLRHNENTRKGDVDLGGWPTFAAFNKGLKDWELTIEGEDVKDVVDELASNLQKIGWTTDAAVETTSPKNSVVGQRIEGVWRDGDGRNKISGVVFKNGRVKVLRYGDKTWTQFRKQWIFENTSDFEFACIPGTVKYYSR